MQFGGTPYDAKRRRQRRLVLNSPISQDAYPHALMMYNNPPTMDITLQEFETLAFERVQVLHFLDTLSVSAVKHSAAYNEKLTKFLRKNYQGFLLPTHTEREVSEAELKWRRKDHISHFIHRLAYCRSEELRRWFLERELDLFKFRFLQEGIEGVQMFLQHNNLTYTPISDEEKERFSPVLSKISADMTEAIVEKSLFYRVPFLEVLNLVSSKKVFLYQGDAFVPQKEFLSIISTKFREHLSKALTLTSRSLPDLEEDDRLIPILKSFNQSAISASYDTEKNKGTVSINDLEELSNTSFPLCMRQVHNGLKETHHLRHWGRIQYSLFLKGIGVNLEDAMKFWRREFGKGIGEEKFEKEHAYNIRHSYGKEGKRTSYSPYSCKTIIMKNTPTSQDHHGCPFKHSSPELLKQKLKSYKCNNETVEEIITLVKGQHFQIACQKYFEATHKIEHSMIQVTHPNVYFDESQRILKGDKPISGSNNREVKKAEAFTPKWSEPLIKQTPTKKPQNDWDDSELEQMMMEYSDQD